MIDLAISLRKHLPKLVFKVYTGDKNILTKALDRAGIKCRSWIAVARLQADQMPKALMECDLGIVFIQSAFSTQGVVPIKLGEYMLAGLPVVGYIGSGAADKLVEEQVFLSVKDDLGIVWPYVRDTVIPRRDELRARAKSLGCDHFSLQSSVLSYAEALKYERR
ncbi:hypothetical protein EE36_00180 [Sulfitobacter sp. EE-36]|nr:hypothetical protein EE36_00180 [Sulfitobacter sp. EE-36]